MELLKRLPASQRSKRRKAQMAIDAAIDLDPTFVLMVSFSVRCPHAFANRGDLLLVRLLDRGLRVRPACGA
jgi:hypothetical protein